MSGRTLRYILIGGLVLAIGVPSVAMGFGEGRALILGKRNPSGHRTLTKETQIIGNTSTYATRQSNKKDGDGGGAIYGCRSNPGNEPCIRANNLKTGRAFEFATRGNEGGRIETGNTAGAPFTTNATGVATGLNADRVDGKEAADFAAASDVTALQGSLLFAVVNDTNDTLSSARGATAVSQAGNDYTVTFNKDVSKCSYTATPVGPTPAALSVQAGAQNTQVVVNAAAPTSFHLQVIC
jgi:hypothetical protein